MSLKLYAHPFSSYCQKVLIALYENDTPFELRMLAPGDEQAAAEHAALWPLKRMPVLVDDGPHGGGGEHHHRASRSPSSRAGAADPRGSARRARRADDGPVLRQLRHDADAEDRGRQHPRSRRIATRHGVAEARELLDTAYRWLDGTMAGREWAAGGAFSLADCAAAPALFYADWAHPIGEALPNVHAYRRRLLARPSFARAVDEARPYRPFFPLGAPDRD